MKDLRINHSKFKLENGGEGVIAVLLYSGYGSPRIAFEKAVNSMAVGNIGYFEMIDANLNNPWVRVIMTNINDMVQEDFDPSQHTLEKLLKSKA